MKRHQQPVLLEVDGQSIELTRRQFSNVGYYAIRHVAYHLEGKSEKERALPK